ncbi:class F sortase [Nocardioides donggukensis]|uniref:Class F sortase n=1 Tax=Nocardioides donggukensis TaxID=2774019 RepID=A0A927K403_9ACTN|nr:class F sortase [Nocardioides donggukensis]MBD8870237.1 class F sortase [Nocardioides donggukensis]
MLLALATLDLGRDQWAARAATGPVGIQGPAQVQDATDSPESVASFARSDSAKPAGVSRRPVLAARPGAPRVVSVPSLGIAAEVDPIDAAGGVLTPPSDARRVGWWAAGAQPGSSTGSVLVTGHTVRAGGGAFDDLEEVRRGSVVRVTTEAGLVSYRVGAVRVLSKGELATEAAELFDPAGEARLVLVTCEDWDGTAYLSNVVVVAEPL